METSEISILTIVDFSRRSSCILKRAKNLIENAVKRGIPISVGHAERKSAHDKAFIQWLVKNNFFSDLVKLSSEESNSPIPNLSRLRNLAAKKISSKYIFLLDVDIYFDYDKLETEILKIKKSNIPFKIYPCVYLTKNGSKLLINGKPGDVIFNEYLERKNEDIVQHIAIPSSVLILKKNDFILLNGFNEKFTGHGYEDFDFISRLLTKYNLLNPHNDFFIDKAYISPLLSVGFRAYLGVFCLENLVDHALFFHLYHEKSKDEEYYKARKVNSAYFLQESKKKIATKTLYENDCTPILLREFFKICKRKSLDPSRYYRLLDNTPRYKIKGKIKKLKILSKLGINKH